MTANGVPTAASSLDAGTFASLLSPFLRADEVAGCPLEVGVLLSEFIVWLWHKTHSQSRYDDAMEQRLGQRFCVLEEVEQAAD